MSVQTNTFKKVLQFIIILSLMVGGYAESMAQEDNRTLKNPNRSTLRQKHKKQNHTKTTRYTGNVQVKKGSKKRNKLAIHQQKVRGKIKPSSISQFTGNYSYRKPSKGSASALNKRLSGAMSYRAKPSQRSRLSANRGRTSNFRGRYRQVNTKANRLRKAKTISSFMGKATYRLRHRSGPYRPRNSSVSSYRAPRSQGFRKAANYNQRRLRRGFKNNKSNPPAYNKSRSHKLQYNSREAKWMMPKPRKASKKKRKGSDEEE